jgi:hypothetical protein
MEGTTPVQRTVREDPRAIFPPTAPRRGPGVRLYVIGVRSFGTVAAYLASLADAGLRHRRSHADAP